MIQLVSGGTKILLVWPKYTFKCYHTMSSCISGFHLTVNVVFGVGSGDVLTSNTEIIRSRLLSYNPSNAWRSVFNVGICLIRSQRLLNLLTQTVLSEADLSK